MNLKKLRLLLIFLLISTIFFLPFLLNNKLIAHGDGFDSYLPLRLALTQYFKNLQFNLWLPEELLGIPFIGTLQSAVFYPINWLYFFSFLIPFSTLFNLNIIIHYALGAWFMYLFSRHKLKLSKTASFASGLIWGFGSFNQAHRGHITVFNAAIWLPLIILFLHDLFEKPNLKNAFFLSMFLAIQFFAGFIQVFIYTFIVVGVYFLVFFWSNTSKKSLFFFVIIALAVLLLIISPQLVQTQEYAQLSYRDRTGTDFLTFLSYNPAYFISLLVPFIFGGAYGFQNWGFYDQVGHGLYIGLMPLIAIPFALYKIRSSRYLIFASLLICISGILMFGKYTPLEPYLEKIPVLGSMRLPSRHRYEFSFALTIFASIGINNLVNGYRKERKFQAAILFILLTLASIFILHTTSPYIINKINNFRGANRQIEFVSEIFSLNSKVFWIQYLLVAANFLILIFLYLRRPKLFNIAMLAILLMDLWFFSCKYDTHFPDVSEIKKVNRLLF